MPILNRSPLRKSATGSMRTTTLLDPIEPNGNSHEHLLKCQHEHAYEKRSGNLVGQRVLRSQRQPRGRYRAGRPFAYGGFCLPQEASNFSPLRKAFWLIGSLASCMAIFVTPVRGHGMPIHVDVVDGKLRVFGGTDDPTGFVPRFLMTAKMAKWTICSCRILERSR